MTSPQAVSAESLRAQAAAANAAVLSQTAGLKIGPVSADTAQQLVGSPAFLQMQVQQVNHYVNHDHVNLPIKDLAFGDISDWENIL